MAAKFKMKRIRFLKSGRCKGKVKIKGRSRRKVCYKLVRVK